MFTVPPDALHLGVQIGDQSGRPIPTVGVLTVAALVVLAGRLSGHTKPVGDLWPADARPTAWSMSAASSASASCCATRARLIRSSTWGGDIRETR